MLFTSQVHAANPATEELFNQMIKGTYNKALACSPLETDPATSLNVTDWMNYKLVIPNLSKLIQIQNVAKEAKAYAETKVASDKVQHCYAGCFVAKKLDYTSGVMVGWLKELKDSSDCDPQTHFELGDYYATIGATANTFDSFCGIKDIQNLSGSEMLEAAKRN